MNIKEYLLTKRCPSSLLDFANFSNQLKKEFKTLDGYAFDFDDSIKSVKLYFKIYTRKQIFNSDFFQWFAGDNHLGYNFRKSYKKSRDNKNSLSALNFAIKYNLNSRKIIKSIYFGDKPNASLVISESNKKVYSNRYYYIYNSLLIKLINRLLKLNMPPHKQAIELSIRGKSAHCSVFPKLNREKLNIKESKSYCQKHIHPLLESNFLAGQNLALSVDLNTENSSLITKGYTLNNQFQKIYFGCFDWDKSVFNK